VRSAIAVLPARIGNRNHAEERAERCRVVIPQVATLPTVRAGTLCIEIVSHLLVEDRPLQRMEHLLALRQRQPGGLDCRLGTDQVGDLLAVLGAIVRDGDQVDAEMHGHSFLCARSAMFTARWSNAMGASANQSRIRSKASI
jgi:hypothetical protein